MPDRPPDRLLARRPTGLLATGLLATRLLAALPPGSFPWLVGHELRLAYRQSANRRMTAPLQGILWALLHVAGAFTAFSVTMTRGFPRGTAGVVLTPMLASILLFQLSGALIRATQALYERGDLDLLLASPVSRRTILWARASAMAAGTAISTGFVVMPFVHGFLLFGQVAALAAYLWVPALACLATGLGILLSLGLFRLLGPRRTRLAAQLLAAAVGLAFAILFQGPNLLPPEQRRALFQELLAASRASGPLDGLLSLPGRAALGEAGPLALLVAAGFGLFALVAWGLAGRFTGAAVAASGIAASGTADGTTASASRPRARVRPFHGGTMSVLRTKELRLLARDPWLLAQLSQQIVSVLPLGFILFRHSLGTGSLAWLTLVAASGVIGGALVWLAVVGEEGADLLAAAPIRPRMVLMAKLQAAFLPVASIVLPVALAAALVSGSAWLALTLLTCSAAAGLSVGMLDLQFAAPGKRGDFRLRHKGNVILGVGELLLSIAWVGVAVLMLAHNPWALALTLPLLAPLPGGLRKIARAH